MSNGPSPNFLPPPMPYLAIFRANLNAPGESVPLAADDGVVAQLESGPIEFSCAVPLVSQRPPSAAMTMGHQTMRLPKDSYLVIRQQLECLDPRQAASDATLRVAEIAGLFDLRFPGVLSDKLHEGFVNDGIGTMLMLDGPMTLSAQPSRDALTVVASLSSDISALGSLHASRRSRFRLAMRWYRRGLETTNQIDKFLSWWTSLEVFPGEGDEDVARKTRDAISPLFPELKPSVVKAKLELGQITGYRGDVLHQGIAFVSDRELDLMSDRLSRLQAIVITTLRILGNLAPGEELNPYLRPNVDSA